MDPITFSLALSLHLGFNNDYNSIHPHIRYNHDQFIAGAYYNSENKISTYIGKRFEYDDFGLEIGFVTGYSDAEIAPYSRGTYRNFFVTPGIEENNIGIVVGTEIKF